MPSPVLCVPIYVAHCCYDVDIVNDVLRCLLMMCVCARCLCVGV